MQLSLNLFARRTGSLFIVSLAVGLLVLLAPSATAIPIILNGSFENPVEPEGGFSLVPTSWTTPIGGGAIIHPPDSLGPLYPPAEDGLQYELLNSGTAIYQSFHISLAGSYQLTWYDNTLTDRSTEYNIFLKDSADNTVASTSIGLFHGAASWNARSLTATLAEGDYRLLFSNGSLDYGGGAISANDNYFALDDVSLDAVVPASVPETDRTAALLGLALGGIALLKSRYSFATKS
jgi:hypothetical protein